jgi:hypothetical protein
MSNENPAQQNVTVSVKYDDFTARYANHALVNVGQEEVYLDFTSGLVPDRPGSSIMPIHTRIVMTPSGVVRLTQLLNQTIKNFQVVQVAPPPTQPSTQIEPAAQAAE